MKNIFQLVWLVPLLPFAGFLLNGLFRKKLSKSLSGLIGCATILGAFAISVALFMEVKSNGGQVLMPKTAIPYVGYIAKFLDTEGNLICGMQYDNTAR